jgi:hypothetical protein
MPLLIGFSMRRLSYCVPVMLSLLAVFGCQRIGERLGLRERPMLLVDGGPICPSTAVLADAVTVTKLKPGAAAPGPANVMLTAEMSQAELKCNYDRVKNTLSVDVSFAVRATRSAGTAEGPDPPLDYFVAVVDAEGNVLSKRVFQSQPALGRNNAGVFTQRVSKFAVPLGMDKRPYDYEILTGFQLTAAELAYNRVPKPLPQPRRQ